MQVILKNLSLINFRNIVKREYDTSSLRVAIAGKNRIGKSNTIQAIYWLLTDKLLDGSSDAASIKPLDDTSKKVEVKATFNVDGKEFEVVKKYYENWVKRRGSSELELAGNITEYVVNGIEMKVGSALEKISQELGLDDIRFENGNKIDSSINLISALTNPLYLTEQVDEKTLRAFVIGLVGDVSDEDIYRLEPGTVLAKSILEKYSGDTSAATKFLKSQISELSSGIENKKSFIDELQKDVDADVNELQEANEEISRITSAIESIKSSKAVENPKITKLKEEVEQIDQEKKLLIDKLNRKVNDFNLKINTAISALMNEKTVLLDKKEKIQQEIFNHQKKMSGINAEIKNLELTLEYKTKEINSLRDKGNALADQEYVAHIDACPNCGFTLNQEQINKERSDFENKKEQELSNINREGKALKLDIENLKLKIEKLKQDLVACEQEVIEDSTSYDSSIKDIDMKIQEEKAKYKKLNIYENADYISLINSRNEKEATLKSLMQQEALNTSTEVQIAELESSKEPYKKVITLHEVYLANQERINGYQNEIKLKVKELNNQEQQLMAVSLYIQTKLKMIDSKVANVFGDIKIQLIKKNIKKDSWDQVCRPCIKGKNTLFTNGSTSEKIITGIAFIECVKRALKLSDLPILFDEGEALDSESINILNTSSQIICAMVNDNYYEPTSVALAK